MSKTTALVLLCCSAVLAACKKDVQVNLPSGFHGRVFISCGVLETTGAIDVDSDGRANASACPDEKHLVILRDGQKIEPEDAPKKTQTGDGIVTAIEFAIP